MLGTVLSKQVSSVRMSKKWGKKRKEKDNNQETGKKIEKQQELRAKNKM